MGLRYTVRKGKHIGRDHILDRRNCQDAYALFDDFIDGKRTIIGVECDGCSQGLSSEVGSIQASAFLVRKGVSLLEQGVPVAIVPRLLFNELLEFLRSIINCYTFRSISDRVGFIKDHLLFTVVGFIITDDDAAIFSAGDGTVIINDDILFLDADDEPLYPGYHLIDRSALTISDATPLPDSFEVLPIDISNIFRLGIGTDAWHKEPDLVHEIWGFKHPAGLQRRLNQWSKTDHRFKDDVSMITVEIEEEILETEANAS